jgi:hypothetical protein
LAVGSGRPEEHDALLRPTREDLVGVEVVPHVTVERVQVAQLELARADLEALKTYVQNVVDSSNPADGDSIIGSAGMALRTVTLHDKPDLAVKQGSVSGTVTLTAKADLAKHAVAFNTHVVLGQSATYQISHTKGGVLDGRVGFEGSTNWSASGKGTFVVKGRPGGPRYRAQNNTLAVFTDPDTIARFTAELVAEHLAARAGTPAHEETWLGRPSRLEASLAGEKPQKPRQYSSAPQKIRTSDLRLRRPDEYPKSIEKTA